MDFPKCLPSTADGGTQQEAALEKGLELHGQIWMSQVRLHHQKILAFLKDKAFPKCLCSCQALPTILHVHQTPFPIFICTIFVSPALPSLCQ